MNSSMKVKDTAQIAVMVAVICVCSWISIPTVVPFTMQTFGVFVTLLLLGGKKGTAAITLWVLLGAFGVPVFSGFQGGPGHIMGPTGGYIIGFLIMGILYSIGEAALGERGKPLVLLTGLFVCYLFGTLWFRIIGSSRKSFGAIAALCVLPYILPDLGKLFLALQIGKRIKTMSARQYFSQPEEKKNTRNSIQK